MVGIQGIIKQKTKSKIILEDYSSNGYENLMAAAMLAGCSANCLKQIGQKEIDWDLIRRLQEEYNNLLYKMNQLISIETSDQKTHTFT